MTVSQSPSTSIIIVNYNGLKWLPVCLKSIMNQTYPDYEVILVDNNSTDGSLAYIVYNYPQVKIIRNNSNLGFASANNIGYQHSRGKYIILLNNDTRVGPEYVSSFIRVFAEIPSCSIAQSQIVKLSDSKILDSCGSYFTSTTFQYYFGNDKQAARDIYNEPFPIFSTKGASMLIKREVIDKVGLFDDNFWSYYEETDFCHRCWLAGFEAWYWPHAQVRHAIGGTSLSFANELVQYHNFKNKLCSLLINLENLSLLHYVPVYLFFTTLTGILWMLIGKPKHALGLLKSFWWNIKHIHHIFRRRSFIKSIRVRSDKEIFSQVLKNPRLQYYLLLFKNQLKNYVD